jgi:antitoxin component HigA of HigAB toxin-antitoxin module
MQKPINTDPEYRAALDELDRVLEKIVDELPVTRIDHTRLDFLVSLIDKYERDTYPMNRKEINDY